MSELEEPLTDEDFDGAGDLGAGEAKDPDGVGRIVDPDEGAFDDTEAESVGMETDDAAALTAEEAAMHVVDDPE